MSAPAPVDPERSGPPSRLPGNDRLFRALVRLFPREFRRQLGNELLRLLADRAAEERRRGRAAAWRFRASASLQLLRDALLERLRELRQRVVGRSSGTSSASSLTSPRLLLPPRSGNLMDSLRIDLRDALRSLRRSPGATVVILVTLGLAIGASTAVFSVVDGVLLSPLPYPDADRIVVLWETDIQEEASRGNLAPANFLDWTDDDRIFAAAAAARGWGPTLTGDGDAELLGGARVSRDYFDVLGVGPDRGRGFTVEEDRPGGAPVVILGHGLWESRFAADPEAIGSEIVLGDEPHTVIGVMPPGFRDPLRPGVEVWSPLAIDAADPPRDIKFLRAIARLQAGVTPTQAREALDAVSARLRREYPDSNEDLGVTLVPLHREIVGDVEARLWLLLGAILLVLLIATANVANLQLARASSRGAELAMRSALGAGRARLARQLLVESLVLSLGGGALGLLLAWGGTQGLLGIAPSSIPRLDRVEVDGAVLLFALLVSILVGVLFGILPALQSTGGRMLETLRGGGRERESGSRGGHLRRGLVVAQIAIALVLIVGSGLLLKSLGRLLAERTGFASGAVVAGLSLGNAYENVGSFVQFHDRALERLRARPETERVATLSIAPFSGNKILAGIEIPGRRDDDGVAWVVGVSENLFRTLDVPVRRGREFTAADVAGSTPVAVVNEAFVDAYLDDEDTLGREITVGITLAPQPPEVPRRIVGVVDDIRLEGLDVEPGPQVFVPYRQYPTRFMYVVLRTDGGPAALAPLIREEIREIDPRVPVGSVATFDQWIGASVAGERFYTVVLSAFGVVALTLGAVGIAGVVAYAVTRRRREFGIRIALGAGRGDILVLVMREGALLTLLGVLTGLPLAALLTRFLEGSLHEVGVLDPWVFGATALALALIALQASFLPARRATRVDPMISLRED